MVPTTGQLLGQHRRDSGAADSGPPSRRLRVLPPTPEAKREHALRLARERIRPTARIWNIQAEEPGRIDEEMQRAMDKYKYHPAIEVVTEARNDVNLPPIDSIADDKLAALHYELIPIKGWVGDLFDRLRAQQYWVIQRLSEATYRRDTQRQQEERDRLDRLRVQTEYVYAVWGVVKRHIKMIDVSIQSAQVSERAPAARAVHRTTVSTRARSRGRGRRGRVSLSRGASHNGGRVNRHRSDSPVQGYVRSRSRSDASNRNRDRPAVAVSSSSNDSQTLDDEETGSGGDSVRSAVLTPTQDVPAVNGPSAVEAAAMEISDPLDGENQMIDDVVDLTVRHAQQVEEPQCGEEIDMAPVHLEDNTEASPDATNLSDKHSDRNKTVKDVDVSAADRPLVNNGDNEDGVDREYDEELENLLNKVIGPVDPKKLSSGGPKKNDQGEGRSTSSTSHPGRNGEKGGTVGNWQSAHVAALKPTNEKKTEKIPGMDTDDDMPPDFTSDRVPDEVLMEDIKKHKRYIIEGMEMLRHKQLQMAMRASNRRERDRMSRAYEAPGNREKRLFPNEKEEYETLLDPPRPAPLFGPPRLERVNNAKNKTNNVNFNGIKVKNESTPVCDRANKTQAAEQDAFIKNERENNDNRFPDLSKSDDLNHAKDVKAILKRYPISNRDSSTELAELLSQFSLSSSRKFDPDDEPPPMRIAPTDWIYIPGLEDYKPETIPLPSMDEDMEENSVSCGSSNDDKFNAVLRSLAKSQRVMTQCQLRASQQAEATQRGAALAYWTIAEKFSGEDQIASLWWEKFITGVRSRNLSDHEGALALLEDGKCFTTGSEAALWALAHRDQISRRPLKEIGMNFLARFKAGGSKSDFQFKFSNVTLKVMQGRRARLMEAALMRMRLASMAGVDLTATALKLEIVQLLKGSAKARLSSAKVRSWEELSSTVAKVIADFNNGVDPLQAGAFVEDAEVARTMRQFGLNPDPIRPENTVKPRLNTRRSGFRPRFKRDQQSTAVEAAARQQLRQVVQTVSDQSVNSASSPNIYENMEKAKGGQSIQTPVAPVRPASAGSGRTPPQLLPCRYCTRIRQPPLPKEQAMHLHRDCPERAKNPELFEKAMKELSARRNNNQQRRGNDRPRKPERQVNHVELDQEEEEQLDLDELDQLGQEEDEQSEAPDEPEEELSDAQENMLEPEDSVVRDQPVNFWTEKEKRPDECDGLTALVRPFNSEEREVYMIASEAAIRERMVEAYKVFDRCATFGDLLVAEQLVVQLDDIYGELSFPRNVLQLKRGTRACLFVNTGEILETVIEHLGGGKRDLAEVLAIVPKEVYTLNVFNNHLIDWPRLWRTDMTEPIGRLVDGKPYFASFEWVIVLLSSDTHRSALFRSVVASEGEAKKEAIKSYLDLLSGRSHACFTRFLPEQLKTSQPNMAHIEDDDERRVSVDPPLPRHPKTIDEIMNRPLSALEEFLRQEFTKPKQAEPRRIEVDHLVQAKLAAALSPVEDIKMVSPAVVWLAESVDQVDLGEVELKKEERPARIAVLFIREHEGRVFHTIAPCLLDSGASTSIMPRKYKDVLYSVVKQVPDRVLRGFNGSRETLSETARVRAGFLTLNNVPMMFKCDMYVANNPMVDQVIIGNDMLRAIGAHMHTRKTGLSFLHIDSQPYLSAPYSTDKSLQSLADALHLFIRQEEFGTVFCDNIQCAQHDARGTDVVDRVNTVVIKKDLSPDVQRTGKVEQTSVSDRLSLN